MKRSGGSSCAEQRASAEDHLLARIALENAVELQPGYAEAWAALAILLVDEYRHLFNPRPNSLERAMLTAERALDADPASQMANYAFAVTQYCRGDLGAFREAAERTLRLEPSLQLHHGVSWPAFLLLGRLGAWHSVDDKSDST